MTCPACAARVEKKLNGIDSIAATVNFATGQALLNGAGTDVALTAAGVIVLRDGPELTRTGTAGA